MPGPLSAARTNIKSFKVHDSRRRKKRKMVGRDGLRRIGHSCCELSLPALIFVLSPRRGLRNIKKCRTTCSLSLLSSMMRICVYVRLKTSIKNCFYKIKKYIIVCACAVKRSTGGRVGCLSQPCTRGALGESPKILLYFTLPACVWLRQETKNPTSCLRLFALIPCFES